MKLILIGIQGSGKSTQGNILSSKLGIPYLSSGHIFRQIAREKTRWGRYVKETINAGYLIPDDKTVSIIEAYLKKPEYSKGYILDGFPRTLPQAKAFKNGVDRVIYIRVSDKEALWRLSYRNNTDQRGDETLKAVLKRIELFHQVTKPVLSYYKRRKMLLEIDGERGIKEVSRQIFNSLRL